MSVLKVKNGDQWDIVPAIKGDPGDPAADESITDDMLVADGIKTEIEWLWGNQLMDSREGEILHAEDAYTAPAVDISVDGKSTQVTTTGKNLLSDATDTWANYTIVQGIYKYVEIDVPQSTRLTVSPTSTAAISGISGFNGYVVFWFDTTMFLNANVIYPINAGTPRVMTFTSGANGKLRVGLVNTMTQEALDVLWAKVKLQLEAGSSATAYEPYTGGKASPNPDYPQEIVSVVNPVLTVAGKNLIASTANGYIDGTGGVYGSTDYYKHTNYIRVAPGQKYVVSQGGTNFTTGIRTAYYNGKKHLINALPMSGVAAFVSTAPANAVYMRTSCQGIYVSEFVVRVGADSVVQPYEPYVGNTVPLLPDGYSLRSLPDGTKDELHLSYLRPSKRAGWAWYSREVTRRVSPIDLGDLKTTYGGTNNNVFYKRWSNGSEGAPARVAINAKGAICPSFAAEGATSLAAARSKQANSIMLCQTGDTAVMVNVLTSEYPTVTAFTTAFAGIIAYYPLATPTTETLDPIELPIMPSQTVNVWSDPATNLKMTYIQDSNLIIENLEATIADITTS